MCVAITLEPGANLTLDEITKMDRANADGVGLGWVEADGVHWWKTTKVHPEEVKENLILTAESPRLLHFRYATAGGTKDELCHPFDISERSICSPMGVGKKIMIHNGHWGRWMEVAKLLRDEDLLPDNGPWSDTRLAAFLAHTDEDWLVALGGRVATLDDDGDIMRMGDWTELRTGIFVSNKSWDVNLASKRGGYEGHRTWKGWGDDEHTPALGSACMVETPTKEEKGHGKKRKQTREEEGEAGEKHYSKLHGAPPGEAQRVLRDHPGAFWSALKGVWIYWDEKTRTMVELAPAGRQGS